MTKILESEEIYNFDDKDLDIKKEQDTRINFLWIQTSRTGLKENWKEEKKVKQ